jgi:DNA invertase Pin-like site-specific DNA recombinase
MNLDTSKLALVYLRQSTEEQVKENIYSLQNQLALVEQAERDGYPDSRIVLIDDDLGVSGRTISGRVGMTRALAMIESGTVGCLYVEDITRLSRDADGVDPIRISRILKAAGCILYTQGNHRDMRDRSTHFVHKIEAIVQGEQWEIQREKLYRAKLAKAREGKVVGSVPRGYRVKREGSRTDPGRDRLIIHEPEAQLIRHLVERLPIAGSVRSLYRETHPLHWPDGSPVNLTTYYDTLKNPIYRGVYYWGNVAVENAHEPIITPDQAAEIDRILSTNKATLRRPSKYGGAELVGLVWCPECRRTISSSSAHRQSRYRCITPPSVVPKSEHFVVDTGAVDRLVRDDLFHQIDAGLIDRIIAAIASTEQRDDQTAEITRQQIAQLTEQKSRWLDKLGREDDPDLADDYRDRIKAINASLKELESKRTTHRPGASAHLRTLDRAAIALLPATWDRHTLQWRRRFIREFVARVELSRSPLVLESDARFMRRYIYRVRILYHSGEISERALKLAGQRYYAHDA